MKGNIKSFGIICILILNFSLCEAVFEKAFNEGDYIESEYVTVNLLESDAHGGRTKRAISDCLDQAMTFNFTVQGQEIILKLTENPNIEFNKPVYMEQDGEMKAQIIPYITEIKNFQDLANNAAIGVSGRPLVSGGCEYTLEGTLGTDDGPFVISPSERTSINEPLIHVVRKVNESIEFFGDFVEDDDDQDGDGTSTKPPRFSSKSPPRFSSKRPPRFSSKIPSRFRRATNNYRVEVFMVIDSLVYDFWYRRMDNSDPALRHNAAIAEIQQYYVFVLNGIDLRYRNIVDPNVAFRVIYAGMYISTNVATSPWTTAIATTNPNSAERPYVDPYVALPMFRDWRQNIFASPTSDHSMLFSKAEFAQGNSTAVAGLAYVGGVCKVNSASVNEDKFNFITLTIAAHELGHNLGSPHDGTGNTCSAGDKNIMAPSVGPSAGATARSQWFFSTCSIDYFETYAGSLGVANCLLSDDSGGNQTEFQNLLTLQPGEYYSMDDQCRLTFLDDTSYFCRGFYSEANYNEICPGAYCSVPGTTSCSKIIPGRGTSCGNKKWCIDGLCVSDPDAPVIVDSCPQGDQPSNVNGITDCSDLLTIPRQCYQSYYETRCCGTCSTLNTGIPGCEYGDRTTGCSALTLRSECYLGTNEELCCEFCLPKKEAYKTGCEYGDRVGNCVDAECPTYDETRTNDCCDTCLVFTTPTPPTTTPVLTTTTVPSTTVTTPVLTTTTVPSTIVTTPVLTTTTVPSTTVTTPELTTTTVPSTTVTTPELTTTTVPSTAVTTPALTTTTVPSTTVTTPGLTTTSSPCTTDIGRTNTCLINGECYLEGEANPNNNCQVCDPASPSIFTEARVDLYRGGSVTCSAMCENNRKYAQGGIDLICTLPDIYISRDLIIDVCKVADINILTQLGCPGLDSLMAKLKSVCIHIEPYNAVDAQAAACA